MMKNAAQSNHGAKDVQSHRSAEDRTAESRAAQAQRTARDREERDAPPHSIRFSARARRVSLRVSPARGLEAVLPKGADPACVPGLLRRFRPWIDRQLDRLERLRAGQAERPDPDAPFVPPASFPLHGGAVRVRLIPAAAAGALPASVRRPERAPLYEAARPETAGEWRLVPVSSALPPGYPFQVDFPKRSMGNVETVPGSSAGELEFWLGVPRFLLAAPGSGPPGPSEDAGEAAAATAPGEAGRVWLREWLRAEAARTLIPALRLLAGAFGFQFTEARIKFQRTRWGSCSGRGNINLNAALIFLPPRLQRYILLHELCHTRQLNHSERYWKELFAVEPNALALDKAMRGAWRHVPAWLHERGQA